MTTVLSLINCVSCGPEVILIVVPVVGDPLPPEAIVKIFRSGEGVSEIDDR
jgi:hypothetical protein